MLLPLPPLYVLVLNACVRGGWTAAEYDGSAAAGGGTWRHTGILASRGDVRIQIEWACLTAGAETGCRWQRRIAEAAVPAGRAAADWCRCPISGTYPTVRLLGYPNEALAAAVADRCTRHHPRTCQRTLRQCTLEVELYPPTSDWRQP